MGPPAEEYELILGLGLHPLEITKSLPFPPLKAWTSMDKGPLNIVTIAYPRKLTLPELEELRNAEGVQHVRQVT